MGKPNYGDLVSQLEELGRNARVLVVKQLEDAIEWMKLGKDGNAAVEMEVAFLYLTVARACEGSGELAVDDKGRYTGRVKGQKKSIARGLKSRLRGE